MNDGFKLTGGDKSVGPARACVRAEDLVAYLYGEATPAESRSFGEHLQTCAACRDELAAFGGVRGQINAWREEVLNGAPRIDFAPPHVPSVATTAAAVASAEDERPARKRSARAALREFFALSPAWLSAGSVAAALAVCALAGLAFARTEVRWDDEGVALRMGVPARTVERRVEVSPPGTFTERQVEEIAERRARQAVEEYQAQLADEEEKEKQVAGVAPVATRERPVAVPVKAERQTRRNQSAAQPRPKRNQRQGLEFESNDDELPRLYDLLREAN